MFQLLLLYFSTIPKFSIVCHLAWMRNATGNIQNSYICFNFVNLKLWMLSSAVVALLFVIFPQPYTNLQNIINIIVSIEL